MTTTLAPASPNPGQQAAARLRPLRLAMFVSGIAPWVPVEKVFMTQLGFTPALVATMAAAYAAVVPVLEIPSGILADRWSRRGVLMLASGAALLSVLVGALSTGVASYIVSAMILGGYILGRSIPDIGKYIHYVIAVVVLVSILPAIIGILKGRKTPATAASSH